MTEHTTLVLGNSKERTSNWVRSHSPYLSHYHSPDSPPSVVGELNERDSDEDSTHSLPPKMVLRYGNGRADIPISHWHYEDARREPLSRHGSHPRSRPHHGHPRDYVRHPLPRAYHDDFSTPPEEIHILPSDPNAQPHRPAGTYRPRRASEPPRRRLSEEPETIIPLPPAQRRPPHSHSHSYSHLEAPPVVYSHSQHIHYDHDHDHPHPRHSHSRSRPPPSIVYPTHHANDHYAPPTIVYSHKAPGMAYTVSAPTGNGFPQYPRIVATPLQPVRSNLSSVYEEPRPYKDESESEGTYYVPGQKVKVLVEPSVYTASSATKLGSTYSPFSVKRPLMSRLMRFASELRPSRRILHRRHSLENTSRARSRER